MLDEEELRELKFFTSEDISIDVLNSTTQINSFYIEPSSLTDVDRQTLQIDFTDFYSEENILARRRKRKWNPSGNIRVEEEVLPKSDGNPFLVGVNNAKVKVRKWGWLVIKTGYTNHNGYFYLSRTRTKRVKYAVYFKNRNKFTVKAASYFTRAKHRGTRKYKKQPWNVTFLYDSRPQFHALVHNAASYYYQNGSSRYRLWMPNNNTHIKAIYSRCTSSQTRPRIIPFHCQVKISRKDEGNNGCEERHSDGIFATTVHELTHVAHMKQDIGLFYKRFLGNINLEGTHPLLTGGTRPIFTTLNGVQISIKEEPNATLMIESWAEGVETIMTNDRYLALHPNYIATRRHNDEFHLWNDDRQADVSDGMNAYTPIVADLIDTFNQRIIHGSTRPLDQVSGYTLYQLQKSLDDVRTIEEWRDNIKNDWSNSTKNNLDELFTYPIFVRDNNQI